MNLILILIISLALNLIQGWIFVSSRKKINQQEKAFRQKYESALEKINRYKDALENAKIIEKEIEDEKEELRASPDSALTDRANNLFPGMPDDNGT